VTPSGPGYPVGGIPLPVVTCNDVQADYQRGNCFKLYSSKNSSQCPSYPRSQCGNACSEACHAQYQQCSAVYVEVCKNNNWGGRRSRRWTDDEYQASTRCSQQLQACLQQNQNVNGNGKCLSYGTGW